MSLAQDKEASIAGPVAITEALGRALPGKFYNGTIGEYCYASANTINSAALPTQTLDDGKNAIPLQRKFLTIANCHASAILWVAFGIGSAPAITAAALSAFGTGNVAAGRPLMPLSTRDFLVPDGATHVAWILDSGATASVVAFGCSEARV